MSSRNKGNRAERWVCELLKKWTNKKFARTPSSGGLQWKNTHAKGDVVCTKEGHYFPFCIEVKFHKDINFSHLLYDVDSSIMEFWAQCVGDAKKAKKVPMLLMRYNRLPKEFFFLAVPFDFWFTIEGLVKVNRVMMYSNKKAKLPPMVILSSRAFFSSDYKQIKKYALNYKRIKNESKGK